jgi:mannose-6-phosphate isomerase-like protein (cupin superfamily)
VRVRLEDQPQTVEPLNNAVVRSLVSADADGSDISVTWVRLAGRHRRLRTDRSTRVYHVLHGRATFQLGAEPPFEIETGDTVVVPRGVAYDFAGEMTYLVMNGPAFTEGDDVYEE